jgi:hypothetical protein
MRLVNHKGQTPQKTAKPDLFLGAFWSHSSVLSANLISPELCLNSEASRIKRPTIEYVHENTPLMSKSPMQGRKHQQQWR